VRIIAAKNLSGTRRNWQKKTAITNPNIFSDGSLKSGFFWKNPDDCGERRGNVQNVVFSRDSAEKDLKFPLIFLCIFIVIFTGS